jgi:HEAT repeat protein
VKRRLFIGLATVTVCALAVALGGWRNAAHTVYRGKSVKAWSLRLYWSDLDKSEATAALHALGPKAVPCLTKLLQASDSDFHKHLWKLLQKLPPRARSVFLRHVNPPNATVVRMAAARSLGIIGPKARSGVPALIGALRDPEAGVRWEAAAALGRIGQDSVPALIEALWDRDMKVRHTATYALGAVGPGASAAIPALIRRLRDQDAGVRASAASSLSGIGAPALPVLMDLLAHEAGTEREAAAKILLGFYGSQGLVGQSRLNLAQDDAPGARALAIEKLGAIQPADDVVLKVLLGSLRDPAAEVRSAALKALAQENLKPGTLVPVLVCCLRDKSPAVRECSARVLGTIGAPARPAVASLKRLAEDREEPACAAAQEALGNIKP